MKKLPMGICTVMVEQDTCQGSPFDCLETGYRNLKNAGYC